MIQLLLITIFFSLLFFVPVEIYLSPVETHCSNIDYFPANIDEKASADDAMTRLHLSRSVIALFVLRYVNSAVFANKHDLSFWLIRVVLQFYFSILRILDRTFWLLETISGRYHSYRDFDVGYLSSGGRSDGTLAHCGVLWEGKGGWRGVLSVMDTSKNFFHF